MAAKEKDQTKNLLTANQDNRLIKNVSSKLLKSDGAWSGGRPGLDIRINRITQQIQPKDKEGKGGKQKLLIPTGEKEVYDMFYEERNRVQNYKSYEQITEFIPLAAQALQVYTDNIIAPDDVASLNTLQLSLNGKAIDENIGRMYDFICQKYEFARLVEEAVYGSLHMGDYFSLVLDLGEELEHLITEAEVKEENAGQPDERIFLDFSQPPEEIFPSVGYEITGESVDNDALLSFNSVLQENKEGDEEKLESFTAEEVADYLNDLVTIHEDEASLKRLMMGSLQNLKKPGEGSTTLSTDPNNKPVVSARSVRELKKSAKGAVVLQIEGNSIIKLTYGNAILGYYFVEYVADPNFGKKSRLERQVGSVLDLTTWNNSGQAAGKKLKDKAINAILTSTLTNKSKYAELLKRMKGLDRELYLVLKRAKTNKKRAVITFVPPEKMVHWTPNPVREYGVSILEKIKFLARLYIGTTANAFLKNAVRQSEMVAFYVAEGTGNDTDNAIQEVIRAVRSREVRFDNLESVTSILRVIGDNRNLFIPSVDGNRPIEVERIDLGGATEIDTPWIEFLRKQIISGLGIPAAFIGFSEEVSFARTISMENATFLRKVLRFQKNYMYPATKFFQLIWKAERPDEVETTKKKEKSETETINPDAFLISFPRPTTLEAGSMAERLESENQVFEAIKGTLLKQEQVDGEEGRLLHKEFLKDRMPGLDWTKLEAMAEKAIVDAAETRVKDDQPAEDELGGSGTDDLGGTGDDTTGTGGDAGAGGLGAGF